MANHAHVNLLIQGTSSWNSWRLKNRTVKPDFDDAILGNIRIEGAYLRGATLKKVNLCEANLMEVDFYAASLRGARLSGAKLDGARLILADLSKADLEGASLTGGTKLTGADLAGANLTRADLRDADLTGADLRGANMCGADLSGAKLIKAHLMGADLSGVNLSRANLTQANLTGSNLTCTILVETNLVKAQLKNCHVYGIAAWNVNLSETGQADLIITSAGEPTITVDSLEVSQFIYLLLNNQKVREIINTVTSKVVLILGRFIEERKVVLDAIKDDLRRRGYLPVLFDFEKPDSRDITETVSTLAHLARFIIADITDAKSIPQELLRIVPNLPSVPVQPLLLASQNEYGMFEHFRRFPWVLNTVLYDSLEGLLNSLEEKVINPAELTANQQAQKLGLKQQSRSS